MKGTAATRRPAFLIEAIKKDTSNVNGRGFRAMKSSQTRGRIAQRVLVGTLYALINAASVEAKSEASDCARVARDNDLRIMSVASASSSDQTQSVGEFISKLATSRVVVIGEQHDQWAHHLTQLEIICRLSRGDRPIAIGLEQFSRPAQPVLDRFVDATIGIRGLLRDSRYFSSWGYDFRLYEPILTFAGTRDIPLVALNASTALIERVRERGIVGLDAAEIDTYRLPTGAAQAPYRQRLRAVFDQHAPASTTTDESGTEDLEAAFKRFVNVQRTWEAVMVTSVVAWLNDNPRGLMVVLAGSGHVVWPHAIPDQLRARGVEPVLSVDVALAGDLAAAKGSNADYRVRVTAEPLTPRGRLGVALDTTDTGVVVRAFGEKSAARRAGLAVGDRITAIDHEAVLAYDDVRRLLWRAEAGDAVSVSVERDGAATEFSFELQ